MYELKLLDILFVSKVSQVPLTTTRILMTTTTQQKTFDSLTLKYKFNKQEKFNAIASLFCCFSFYIINYLRKYCSSGSSSKIFLYFFFYKIVKWIRLSFRMFNVYTQR